MATNVDTGMIYLLDVSTNRLLVKQKTEEGVVQEVQSVSTGKQPIALYLMKKAGKIVVANAEEQTVSVFTMGGRGTVTLFETVNVSGAPLAIAATPDESFVYISLQNQGIGRFRFGEDSRLVWVETLPVKGDVTALAVDPLGESLSGFIAPAGEVSAPDNSRQKCCRKFFRKLQKEMCHHVLGKGICGENYYYHIYNIPSPPSDPHWPRSSSMPNKISLNVFTSIPYVAPSVRAVWDAYVDEALAYWSKSSVLSISKSGADSADRLTACIESSGEYEGAIQVCVGNYMNKGYPPCGGHVYWRGCGGYKVQEKRHPSLFKSKHFVSGFAAVDTSNVGPGNTALARYLFCQEIGHALGLSLSFSRHRDENHFNRNLGTCMDYTNQTGGGIRPDGTDAGPSNEHPDAEDYRQLEALHSHVDVGVTRDKSSWGRRLSSFSRYTRRSAAVQWPRPKLVFMNSNRSLGVYEQNFGRGRSIVYFATR